MEKKISSLKKNIFKKKNLYQVLLDYLDHELIIFLFLFVFNFTQIILFIRFPNWPRGLYVISMGLHERTLYSVNTTTKSNNC
jgi:hypothetical protein